MIALVNGANRKHGKDAMPKGIQSVEIAYRILAAIQEGPGAVSLKEIAARAGLGGSAAHNYLVSLQRTGMVRSGGRGQYRLGPALASLGLTAARDVEHFDLVRERAILLSERAGLGTAVTTWSDSGPLILFNKSDVRSQIFALRNGLISAHSTAAGHVFIGYLPCEATLPVLLKEMKAESPDVNESAVRKWMDDVAQRVRQDGYAALDVMGIPGYSAIGAPIWDADGGLAYVLSLTGPSTLMDTQRGGGHAPLVIAAAQDLSRLMGAPGALWREPRAADGQTRLA